jgi:hypothetical protein
MSGGVLCQSTRFDDEVRNRFDTLTTLQIGKNDRPFAALSNCIGRQSIMQMSLLS